MNINAIMIKKERFNKNFLDEFRDYDFSKIKETKIFLVGSIRFRDYFIKIESILQIIYNKLVGICSVDGLLNKDKFNTEEWDKLQEIAFRKLSNQEAILVLDVENYVGEQSNEEIEYFKSVLHKPVYYLSRLKFI
jgi:hypothetical protein